MTDPLALLPLALGARRGRVDGIGADQLVAAGLTLLRRSAPLVRALSGRRAAILLPTSASYVTALAACEGRGAVLINPLAASAEIAYQLTDASVGAVFTTSALAARLPSGFARVLLDDAPLSARTLIAERDAIVDLGSHTGLELEGDARAAGSDEEAVVIYTSAMAGTPLGAILTHRNLLANARSTIEAAELTSNDHSLAILPFAHLFGLTVTLDAPLLAGARVTTMERFNAVRALEILATNDVTLLVGVPTLYAGLLAALERWGGTFRSTALRLCVCGGAPLAPALQRRWHEVTGVELRQGYGLTEAGPVCLFNRVALPNREGQLGLPFPGVDVSIRDVRSADPLEIGDVGEVCVAGDNVSPGYVRGGEHGLARDGRWLRTGDLGRMEADGAVTFCGLRKAMFTRTGFNIYPRELERAVGRMPGVRSVRVRAVPEPARENDIALDIAGDVTADAVKRWCEHCLSAYKQPSEINIG